MLIPLLGSVFDANLLGKCAPTADSPAQRDDPEASF